LKAGGGFIRKSFKKNGMSTAKQALQSRFLKISNMIRMNQKPSIPRI